MNKHAPPRFPLRFFRWYCHRDFLEDIEGDLLEKFENRIEERGLKYARWKFCVDVLLLFRPGIIRSIFKSQQLNQYSMYKNYFKVGIRNMLKHKFYSALNILGLALGLTASLLIGLYIHDELSFDKFHKDYQNIYQVGLHVNFGGQDFRAPTTDVSLAKAMVEQIPGVEQIIRLYARNDIVIRHNDKVFTESKYFYSDPNFFGFFSFKLLEGDVTTALSEPYTLVLTAATAQKYFGSESAIGQSLVVGNEAFKVTGIAEEAPNSSQIQYDILLSSSSSEYMQRGWFNAGIYTYYRKSSNTPLTSVDSLLRDIMMKHIAPGMGEALGMSFQDIEASGGGISLFSYSFVDSHLFHPEIEKGTAPVGDIQYVYLLATIGSFILLIACINFMNLSTARSASRAMEVGLRKAFGSVQIKLVAQFLTESFVYVFIALLIALGGTYLLLPSFNLLSAKVLSFGSTISPEILGAIISIFVIVTLVAGSYPAFYLTSFKPAAVLKGNMQAGRKSKGIRSSLVVVQFIISISLAVCTLVVFSQINFLGEINIGLDKENVLILENANRLKNNQRAFREALNSHAAISSASYTNNRFPEVQNTGIYHTKGNNRDFLFDDYFADHNNLETLRIELLQGRNFSEEFISDSLTCIINEAAAEELGWSNPVNKALIDMNGNELKVIGVVKNFNFESFKFKVKPLVILLQKRNNYLLVRYEGSARDVVAITEAVWRKLVPNEPFEYTFLDQNFDALFREDQRLGQIFAICSFISISVACLGLVGLAAFTAEQRTKEIGIRKVLGASVASINAMLSRQFMVLVLISFVIASLIGWYVMNEWLSTYAYRIELGPILFLLAGLTAAVIAWLTVSYHFIKAARSNPIDALKYE